MWSRKHDKCIICGTSEIKHIAKGLCRNCYATKRDDNTRHYQRNKRGVADRFLTKEKLIELYVEKGLSLSDIGKIAGCTRVNVHYKLKKLGIFARSKTEARTMALDKGKIKTTRIDEFGNKEEVIFQKIRYNENFFKEWSAEMAYILGLIYTDGNLTIRKDTSGYTTGILNFAQKDKEIVEKFLNLLDCDALIRFRKRKEYANTTAGELFYFSIGNNDIAGDLVKLGVTSNKSLKMKFPDIPNKYLRHFIRGFFDGDGSVYLEEGKYIRIKLLSGSKEFIKTLNNLLIDEGFSNRSLYGGTPSTPNAYFIRYTSSEEALKFYNYIYNGVSDKMYYVKKKKIFQGYFKIQD